MKNLVSIKDLHFSRNSRMIFDGLNLVIPQGKVVAVMGPSGTGKTTLLNLISGQLAPESGQVTVFNQEISQLARNELYQLRRKMGMLFQAGGLFTHLSVFENVAFPLREHTRLSESIIRDIVLLKLEMVGLRGTRDLMPFELSGGMARRVALARAVALDPELILYDEPFAGQDPISMGVIARLVRTLNDTLGLTTVIVSHDVQETLAIADYIYVISGGQVIGEGTPDKMMHEGSGELRQFLHGEADGPVPFHYPAPRIETDLLGPIANKGRVAC